MANAAETDPASQRLILERAERFDASEYDIRSGAKLLMNAWGPHAWTEARGKAIHLKSGGEESRAANWRRIADAIAEMNNPGSS